MSTWNPFDQSNPMLHKLAHHPESEIFRDIVKVSSSYDLESIARLWISEGIPFAFKDCAGVYEELRFWLACRLRVNAKDITLNGSGRIGFSMAPYKYGNAFGGSSDFDMSLVDAPLFDKCAVELRAFKEALDAGEVDASDTQLKHWSDYCSRLNKLLADGYINTFQTPPLKDYTPTIVNIRDSMWRASERLKVTESAPPFTKINARLYRSWDDLVNRVAINLASLKSLEGTCCSFVRD